MPTTESGCIQGSSCIGQELRNALQSEELCKRKGKVRVSTILPKPRVDEVADLVALLRACTKNNDFSRGSTIHDDISKRGLIAECSDALVTMYAKCGHLQKAQALLDKFKSLDVITWTALIAGYVRDGHGQKALDCFERMQHEGIAPDAFTYSCLLKACGIMRASSKGEEIHDEIVRQGLLETNCVLGSALVDMYAKCGALSKALDVFEKLPSQNVVSWSTLIAAYAQEGQGEQALICFECMQRDGICPNAVTYVSVLQACATTRAAQKGMQIHDEIAGKGLLRNNVVLGAALVDMYAKCGLLSRARSVLEKLPTRDVVSWSALIAGYAQEGEGEQALNCFERMLYEGIHPNALTYAYVLKACASTRNLDKGKKIHAEILRQDVLQSGIVLGAALVDMYSKCGAVARAQRWLEELPARDVVAWNALIAGYTQEGLAEDTLNCFERMQCDGIIPDAVTYTCVLKACANIGSIDKGRQIHDNISMKGFLQNSVVLGNALVAMYAKCGAVLQAHHVLEELPSRNDVSWNTLLAGYAQEGQGEQVLNCCESMRCEGILPSAATFMSLLNV